MLDSHVKTITLALSDMVIIEWQFLLVTLHGHCYLFYEGKTDGD